MIQFKQDGTMSVSVEYNSALYVYKSKQRPNIAIQLTIYGYQKVSEVKL